METNENKLRRYESALALFVNRLKDDRYAIGAVLQGSLCLQTIWRQEKIHLWIIEMDGVTRRRKFDGEEKHVYRTFIEEGILIEAELIPRMRFKQMMEGASRTAFQCNFFAKRILLYSADPSLEKWFEQANLLATKDQKIALWIAANWLCHPLKYLERLIHDRKDYSLAQHELLWSAWTLAAIEIIQRGEVYEDNILKRGLELNPNLMEIVYSKTQNQKPASKNLKAALAQIHLELEEKGAEWFQPLIQTLKKKGQATGLSEGAKAGHHHAGSEMSYPGIVNQIERQYARYRKHGEANKSLPTHFMRRFTMLCFGR